jgi:hypothetical protein
VGLYNGVLYIQDIALVPRLSLAGSQYNDQPLYDSHYREWITRYKRYIQPWVVVLSMVVWVVATRVFGDHRKPALERFSKVIHNLKNIGIQVLP